MDFELRELVRMSRALGADAALTQGGGGNTSAKTAEGEFMYIKASGSSLAQMRLKRGWRRLRLAAVMAILQDKALGAMEMVARERAIAARLLASGDDGMGEGVKPSIEAHFHSLLGRYTAHLHPMAAGPYICGRYGKAAVESLFGRGGALWLDYADLGYMSAKAMLRGVRGYEKAYGRKPRVVFLQKHGLVVTGESAEAVLEETARAVRLCWKGLGGKSPGKGIRPDAGVIRQAKRAIQKAGQAIDGAVHEVRYYDSAVIRAFLRREDARALAAIGPLVPHEISYAHGAAVWAESLDVDALAALLSKRGISQATGYPVFLVPGAGLFVMGCGLKSQVVKEVMEVGLMTRMRAEKMGGALPLTKRQREFIYRVYIA